MSDAVTTAEHAEPPTRRDFIHIATVSASAIGAGFLAWPFVRQMSPAADTRALSSTEIDVSRIEEGAEIRLLLGGKPVFVRHRTKAEIEAARAAPLKDLKDPQSDEQRLRPDAEGKLNPAILVMFGSCTHLGCVPLGDGQGDYGGWFCPCHGSHYDTAGRIRKGPAPKNLVIPTYEYVSATTIKISL